MKQLNRSELSAISAGLTYDQVLGRGFAFGSCVGMFSGAIAVLTQNQNPVPVAIGAICGTGVGGFAGALVSIPFSMFFPDTEAQFDYFEL